MAAVSFDRPTPARLIPYRGKEKNERGNLVDVWAPESEWVEFTDAMIAPGAYNEQTRPGYENRVSTGLTLFYRDQFPVDPRDRVFLRGRVWMVEGEPSDWSNMDPFGSFGWGGNQLALKAVNG